MKKLTQEVFVTKKYHSESKIIHLMCNEKKIIRIVSFLNG